MASSNFEDEKAFKEYTGMSLKKYAETYKLDRDLLLTKELDKIYDLSLIHISPSHTYHAWRSE